VSFFEDLFRVFTYWVSTWPTWFQWALIIVVGPVMVIHFALWVMWHLGWFDDDEDDNVILFPKDHP
jgi:hypothetical protein